MLQDLRFALRNSLKRPGLAVTSILILAVGLGGSTAAFSVLYQLVLRPIPYPHPEQLTFIHNRFPKGQVPTTGVSGYDYAEIRQQRGVFSDAAVFYWNDLVMTGAGDARHLDVVNASASLFSVLGMRPQLGRVYAAREDRRGAPGTVVLSDALWRSEFHADPHAVGRIIRLNGAAFIIVGVMPRAFAFPSRETQAWVPVALPVNEFTLQGGRLEKWLHMVARRATGVDLRKADAALKAIGAQLAANYPMFYPAKEGWHFEARQVADEQTQAIRNWLYLALAAVIAILLAACTTVGGLVVVRIIGRSGEIAIRKAMGALNSRIVSQILTEVGLLAALGCAFGILFSVGALRLVNLYGPVPEPILLNTPALIFGFVLTLISTILAGVVPAQVAVRLPVDQTLKSSGTRVTSTGAGIRSKIVAVQIAFAIVLIFTASELNRSFLNLTRVPLGFEENQLWTGAVTLPAGNYTANQSWNTNFFEPLLTELSSMPGVESASAGNALPFNPSGTWTEGIRIPGHPAIHPHPEAQLCLALPNYFKTLGVPLIKGGLFTSADRAGTMPVAVVDEEFARRYFRGEEPLGKLISVGAADTLARIIGVVGAVHNSDLGGPSMPEVYYPELQQRTEAMYLMLRVSGNIDPTASVRRAIGELDPGVALYDVQFMQARVASSLRLRQFVDLLLNGLAITGFALALIGLYGSLAHLVELRYREIGIRAALGATQYELVALIVARATGVLVTGVGIGLVSGLIVSRIIRTQLFGTTVADPAIWMFTAAAILLLAVSSCLIPAWRAARIDPATALRSE